MSLTFAQFRAVFPVLSEDKAKRYFAPFLEMLKDFQINTSKRVAAFVAQIGHESLDLTAMVEWGHKKPINGCKLCLTKCPHEAGEQYEGRVKNLGNTQPGDGVKYKGRGPIQLTGRDNYTRCGAYLKLDLVNHPEMVEEPLTAFKTAGWYWVAGRGKNLNLLADASAFDDITLAINGGYNGKADRDKRYIRALSVLGVQSPGVA